MSMLPEAERGDDARAGIELAPLDLLAERLLVVAVDDGEMRGVGRVLIADPHDLVGGMGLRAEQQKCAGGQGSKSGHGCVSQKGSEERSAF